MGLEIIGVFIYFFFKLFALEGGFGADFAN